MTRGPLPDRNTLYSSAVGSMGFVAASSPRTVLPAPATPVTKQMAFSERAFVVAMIEATVPAAMPRLVASASAREISVTEWPRWSARIASSHA
jgi:hypothetical protein